ncbi:glutathione S-transferase [Rhodoplanes sp. TEM]|uniref:Glutathione S-transferase n=1 Tax=Rhodoplanes tepidamans TaxID=200616 RepID=A0ABT5JDL6_RHOTP|nr:MULTISPECIES: glutathione S-transferase [Rhodoplanes]MDC7787768.1 glutathione S-transferase [Rhodoplanes tepidamans]MDC7982669.1 glutathione S-transferase [Rhodoplanes sp. TEM]MDQ0357684.1 glutathione S-transferase [Rhodoplanes tepidamans]
MTAPAPRLVLHRHPLSGHAHRVELLLSLLGLAAERIDVDLAAGAHRRPEFVAKNPFGQIPVLQDGDIVIADSNAILVYLARRYDAAGTWYPADAETAAEIQRWLSVAAGPLAAGPNRARLIVRFGAEGDLDAARATAHGLFGVLDRHLATRRFLVGRAATIADLALYSYTAHAPEGGVALAPYPGIEAWLSRVEALPGFVPMPASPAERAA